MLFPAAASRYDSTMNEFVSESSITNKEDLPC